MAALQCEICGGKLMGKPGGIFECDSCGMEYDTAWAKAKIQEIKGTVKVEGTVEVQGTVKVEGGVSVESLLKRGQLALEDGKWDDANVFFDEALNYNPECAEAYLGKLMADLEVSKRDNLKNCAEPFNEYSDYKKTVRFADDKLKNEINGYIEHINARIAEQERTDEEQKKIATERGRIVRKKIAPVANVISAGVAHSLGLKSDGTVVACGDNEEGASYISFGKEGRCDVGGWRDIVAVSAGRFHSLGLKSDGTVVACGLNQEGQCNVSGWRGIVAVSAGSFHSLGLKSDGTVVACGSNPQGGCNVSGWRDIVAVSAGRDHSLGLKADGTVVACGVNHIDQCDVDSWRDIVAVSAGNRYSLGLKANGTVVACGWTHYGRCDVGDWRDIVAVSAGFSHSLGLKSDGTVVACGSNQQGECNVSGWRGIVAVSAEEDHTLGLKSDGTVVACGSNCYLQSNVDGWKLFNDYERYEEERKRVKLEKKCAEWRKRRDDFVAEQTKLQAELPTLKGLFSGGRRKEVEARLAQIPTRIAEIDSELARIEKELAALG